MIKLIKRLFARFTVCPECGAQLIQSSGCCHCPVCGWEACG